MALGHRPLGSAALGGSLSVAANEGVAEAAGASTAAALAGSIAQAAGVAAGDFIPAQFLRPTSDIAANGWLPSTGSDLYAMLDEETQDAADYIYSPDNPTTQQFEVKLGIGNNPGGTDRRIIRIGLQAIGLDTNFDFDLVEGSTVRDSWTESVTVAAGAVTRTRTLSAGVVGAITSYSDLRIRGIARA